MNRAEGISWERVCETMGPTGGRSVYFLWILGVHKIGGPEGCEVRF